MVDHCTNLWKNNDTMIDIGACTQQITATVTRAKGLTRSSFVPRCQTVSLTTTWGCIVLFTGIKIHPKEGDRFTIDSCNSRTAMDISPLGCDLKLKLILIGESMSGFMSCEKLCGRNWIPSFGGQRSALLQTYKVNDTTTYSRFDKESNISKQRKSKTR